MLRRNKTRKSTLAIVVLLSLSFTGHGQAGDEDSIEARIARAKSAAPANISDEATIVDVDGTILLKGSNRWTCLPGIGLIPGDKHPMCNDAAWMGWMKAAAAGEPFSTDVIGISYMLMGDALVNNNDPNATDPNDGGVWVQEGPHVMMLMPTREMMADLPRDPFIGGPYVMWGNTPLEHVMVPVPGPAK
ncbi:MAG: hypothetical protein IH908_04935 [Proteobacteria bacterium]|nr:hypothetical protein [Pseudomonadota bacterium]